MNNEKDIQLSDETLAAIAKQGKESYDITQSNDPDVFVNADEIKKEKSTKSAKSKPVIHGLKSNALNTETSDKELDAGGIEEAMLKDIGDKPIEITDEDLRAGLPDVDDDTFKEASLRIRTEIENYRKGLILNYGFTFEEATIAAKNHAMKRAKEENDAYLSERPKVGVIEIDKKNVDDVTFSDEEKDKLHKVKAIKLVVVEDAELKTIPIEKIDKKHKASYIQRVEGVLSKYSIPAPITCDFMTFKGAQIMQLASAVQYNDETLADMVNKKANLIYDRFIGGTVLKKYDESGKVIMSYNDFINRYYFHDIDLGLFGVFIASSPEDVETGLTCAHCHSSFTWKYSLKSLINMDSISDDFKQCFDNILGRKTDEDYLVNLYKERSKLIRAKSPFSNNIFNIGYPTIGRAINIYNMVTDPSDEAMIYLASIALFVNDLYLYNANTGKYVQVEEDEYRELFDALQVLPQSDIDILVEFIKNKIYTPEFILKSKCPYCGHDMMNNLSIDDLVFLIARDSSKEIRM